MAKIGIIKKPRYNSDLISRVALNCNDISFFDFKSDIYGEAIFRAEKKIAERYNVLDREVTVIADSVDDPIAIGVNDIKEITNVTVNGYRLKREDVTYDKNQESKRVEGTYQISFGSDQEWYIQYTNTIADGAVTEQVVGDEIVIKYESVGSDPDTDTGVYILPEKYIEETVRIATLAIARWGIAKYQGTKRDKYISIVRTWERSSAKDQQRLEKDESWAKIKPFKYI